jgi:MobA/MobL family
MPIPYARFSPIPLTTRSGASVHVAYVSRSIIANPLGGFEDHTRRAGDLLHEEILLPADAPPELADRDLLARAIDQAELSKVRTALRTRLPQAGLALIVALPAPHETSLLEAAEISRRIAMLARGSLQLPIHLAIHAAMTNRHAHMLFGTRPLNPDGSFGQRVRDFVASVRTCDHGIAVVEAVRWPDFVSEVQESFLPNLEST